MADALSVLENVAKVRALFPAGFDAIGEALKAGVKSVRLRKSSLGIAAYYSPEENAVDLDPDADWEKVAVEVAGRYPWLGVTPENVIIFVYAHELGHCLRRSRLLGMPRRNLRGIRSAFFFMDQIAIGEEEAAADEYAKERFKKWQRGRP